MLNFTQAIEAVRTGKKVYRAADDDLVLFLSGEDLVQAEKDDLTDEAAWEDAVLRVEDYGATDWRVLENHVEPIEEDEAYMYFSTEKNRWISTTNPLKHKEQGHRVAIFVFSDEV